MNKWIKHLKEFRRKHPDMSLSEAMEKAKETYKSDKKESTWF